VAQEIARQKDMTMRKHLLAKIFRRMTLSALLFLLVNPAAFAGWQEDVAHAPLLGQGRFCLLAICLYDAQLWSAGNPLNYDTPFALLLTYRHGITRARFADTGIDEIKRLAARPVDKSTLSRWHEYMMKSLVDVKAGDSICGVFLPGKGARFYANGQLTAEIDDPQFARAFFDIWLNANTRGSSLREHLLKKPD
jgi:hypothetical protein